MEGKGVHGGQGSGGVGSPSSQDGGRRGNGAASGPNKRSTLHVSIADVTDDKNDGSISDSAVSSATTSRPSGGRGGGGKHHGNLSGKVAALVGFSRKSHSSTQIGPGE